MKFIYLILLLLAWSIPGTSSLLAQFEGGSGDGYSSRTTIQLDLTGVPVGIRPLYAGGQGDGFDQDRNQAFLNGQLTAIIYGGGHGDGFDTRQASFTLNGEDLAMLYAGGSGDGFDRNSFSATLGGESIAGLYAGGAGDGFDRNTFTATLSGESIAGLYAGGAGDGFDRSNFAGDLMGEMLLIYGGGVGDGFDHSQESFTLSGFDLSKLYGGGDGDGFDVNRFQGVAPLPLTLLTFDAFPQEDFVLLKWETEDEIATDFFTIEKTRDGRDFVWVGDETAAGFSEPGERIYYEMEDHDPYLGTSFYRLQTTDFDGAISLSHLVEVNFSSSQDWDFTLFPNPNTGQHFGLEPEGLEAGEILQLEVIDAQGRSLFREELEVSGPNGHQFQLANRLPPGSYLIRAEHAEQGVQAKILIVGGQ